MKRLVSIIFTMFAFAALATPSNAATPLVDTAWLQDQLKAERIGNDVIVIDIRNKIDGGSKKKFEAGHIPGAVYSNYLSDGWRTTIDEVVGKLPPVESLEALLRKLGINNSDHVVVMPAGKSSLDFGSAARVYWTFKVLGHDAVSILDGGYAAWVKAGAPVETGATRPVAGTFTADFRPEMIASTADVLNVVNNGGAQLVDARPPKQFKGLAKHGKSLAAGTIPGSINLPEGNLVPGNGDSPVTGKDLAALIKGAKIDISGDTIAFCNTGHWAATAWFSLSELAGNKNTKLYDGSMVEWTRDESLPLQVSN